MSNLSHPSADRIAFCDPTSTPKLPRLIPGLTSLIPSSPSSRRPLTHISPNILELSQMYNLLSDIPSDTSDLSWSYINSLNLLSDWRAKLESFGRKKGLEWIVKEGIVRQAVGLLPFVESLWIKAGSEGLVHLRISSVSIRPSQDSGSTTISHKLDGIHKGKHLVLSHHVAPKIRADKVVSTTGAGDTLVGGIVAGLVGGNGTEDEWIGRALEGVGRSLRSRRAVA